MDLGKLFKYGILAASLTGNILAMEGVKREENPKDYRRDLTIIPQGKALEHYGGAFSIVTEDICNNIFRLFKIREWRSLAQTSRGWNQLAQPFLITSFGNFDQININHGFSSEIEIYACTSDSLYIFLPFQENGETEKATEWHQTTPWRINGYTGKAIQLPILDGEINSCTLSLHPDGIVLPDWRDCKYPSLLKIQDGALQKQPVFQNMPEAENMYIGHSFACTPSKVAFVWEQTLSCYYDLNDYKAQKITVPLGAVNLSIFNFKDKFLVHGNNPESLWVINPEMGTLIEKRITLPEELSYCRSTSDGDNLVISGTFDLPNNQRNSHFLIENISSDQPTTTPLVFLPDGYNSMCVWLKNNHVFSIGYDMSNPDDRKGHEKSGVFVIYDLINQHQCFQKFMPGFPAYGNFIGTTLFFETSCQCDVDDYHVSDSEDSYVSHYSLMGIDLKNWL